jgi:hypothetical protein
MISAIAGGDIGAQIAMIQTRLGEDDKHTSEAMRQSAEDAEDVADEKELSAMTDKANMAFGSSLVSAAGDFASAGFTADEASQMGDNIGAQGPQKDALDASVKLDEARSQAIGGEAKLATAGLNFAAASDDTDIEQAKQAAQHADREVQDASDYKKSEQDGVDKALDFYQSYETTNNAATMAAIRA